MSNAARNFRPYSDYDDDDDDLMPRRPNVPGDPRPTMPTYRTATPRLLGDVEVQGRPVNIPRPLQGQNMRVTGNMPIAPTRSNVPLPTRAPNFDPRRAPNNRPGFVNSLNLSRVNGAKLALIIGGAIVGMALITLVVTNVISWWNTWQDDMTYGRPRTMQLSGWVGHNEQTGFATNFIAQNINGEVNIIEIPGGDSSKTVVIKGPRLFAKNAELIPIKIRLEDVNADGHVDLIVTADGAQSAYLNESGRFRPATDSELAKFKLRGGN